MIYRDPEDNQIKTYDIKINDNISEMKIIEIFQIGYDSEFKTGTLPKKIEKVPNWISSEIKIIENLFDSSKLFNQDISLWDTSNIINMSGTFGSAKNFNQDISNWDVRNVTSMFGMFYLANKFNQNISKWDVSNVRIMRQMFWRADFFNQDLSKWNVKNVTDHRDFDTNSNPEWTDDKKPKWN